MSEAKDTDKSSNQPFWATPAKSREWTSQEVGAAVEYLKQYRPSEWAELERLELATGDLRESQASGLIFAVLGKLHPECEPSELINLEFAIRLVRRANLGLK